MQRWEVVSLFAEPNGSTTTGHVISSQAFGAGTIYEGSSPTDYLTHLQPPTSPSYTMYGASYNNQTGLQVHNNSLTFPQQVCDCSGSGGWPRPGKGETRDELMHDDGFIVDRTLPIDEQRAAMQRHLEEYSHAEARQVVGRGTDSVQEITVLPQLYSAEGLVPGDQLAASVGH